MKNWLKILAVVLLFYVHIGGMLFDKYGNYTLAFELNMLIAACGIVALFFAVRPTPPTGGSDGALEEESVRA